VRLGFVFLLIFAIFCGCAHNIDKSDFQTVSIVVHARSEHDVKKILPILLRHSEPVLLDARIKLEIIEIRYEIPELDVTFSDLDKFADFDDGNIHVFFVHEYRKSLSNKFAGIQYSKNWTPCAPQIILITDKTSWTTLAHEIGHFFGLDHSSDLDNIMHSGNRSKNADFNDSQIARMHHMINRRNRCRY